MGQRQDFTVGERGVIVEQEMAGTGPAQIQSPDEVYGLIRTAMTGKQPIAAMYESRQRLLCPHILGRNKEGQLRLLGDQYGGESGSGLHRKDGRGDWRCLALEKLSDVRLLEAPWQTTETRSRRPTCIDQIEMIVQDQPDPQKGQ